VEEAQESKAPTERFIDRFSRCYTPGVLVVSALVAVLPPLLAERERPRGKMPVFLHSIHLQRTKATLPCYEFWPTGAHLDQLFGERFAVIGGALGTSDANFVRAPEAGSLEGVCWSARRTASCRSGAVKGLQRVRSRPPAADRQRATECPIYAAHCAERRRFRRGSLPPLRHLYARRDASAGLISKQYTQESG
jgi:hypothetical protein